MTIYLQCDVNVDPAASVGNYSRWWDETAAIHLDYENDRAYIDGVAYATIADAKAADAILTASGVDYVPLPTLAASYALCATGTTGAIQPANGTSRYMVALDDGADASPTDELIAFGEIGDSGNGYVFMLAYTGGANQIPGFPNGDVSWLTGTSTDFRLGIRMKASDILISKEGATTINDVVNTLPTLTRLVIGNRTDGTRAWTGGIGQILLINQEINEATLNGKLA